MKAFQEIVANALIQLKNFMIAQLKLFIIALIILSIGLYVIDVPFFFLVALLIAVIDILPVIGSAIVFIPWMIYGWFWADPTVGWQLLILFIILEAAQLIIEPFLVGHDLDLPIWVPLVVSIGSVFMFNNLLAGIFATAALPFISSIKKYIEENNSKSSV